MRTVAQAMRERCEQHGKVERDDGFVRNGLRGHDAQDELQAGVGEQRERRAAR